MSFEEVAEFLTEIDRRKNIGVRKDFEKVGEDLFGAAPVFEPIAYDGNFSGPDSSVRWLVHIHLYILGCGRRLCQV